MANATGNKSTREPTRRVEKLLEFVHYFNLFLVSLFQNCNGPLDTFFQPVGISVQPLTAFFDQIAGLK